jgi:hypothetical protein
MTAEAVQAFCPIDRNFFTPLLIILERQDVRRTDFYALSAADAGFPIEMRCLDKIHLRNPVQKAGHVMFEGKLGL